MTRLAENPTFFGDDYQRERDYTRLAEGMRLVYRHMRDEQWHTLEDISEATGVPEASASADLRSLRRPENGGYYIEKVFVKKGLYKYRLLHNRRTNYKKKVTKEDAALTHARAHAHMIMGMTEFSGSFIDCHRDTAERVSKDDMHERNRLLALQLMKLLDDTK